MKNDKKTAVPGILLFYEDRFQPRPSHIWGNLDSFSLYSRFPIYPVNLIFGLPTQLQHFEFSACIFHYTLPPTILWLTPDLENYVNSCHGTYKIAIFQDEIWYFEQRFSFLRRCKIDCLYSRHKPRHVREIYAEHVPVKDYVYYLPGYVADDLIARGESHNRAFEQRPIDVGYRGRRLPFYMGRGSQEKLEIGLRFSELAAGRDLKVDIRLEEDDRLFGEKWDRFLASSKAVLGVEGGVSVIDHEGKFCRRSEQVLRENPHASFEEFARLMGNDFAEQEDRIYYRSLTPRHFEAAAFRCLQILFKGEYDGLMKPGVHYVPLQKDFSNFDQVLSTLKNPAQCEAIIENAHRDLIASQRYSYAAFIKEFDDRLIASGVEERECSKSFDKNLRDYLKKWITLNRMAQEDCNKMKTLSNEIDAVNRSGQRTAHLYRRTARAWHRLRLNFLNRRIQRIGL